MEELRKAAVNAELAPLPDPEKETEGAQGERATATNWKPLREDLDAELAEAGNEEQQRLRERQREMIDSLDLSKYVYHCFCFFFSLVVCSMMEIVHRYAIDDSHANWEDAKRQIARNSGVKGKMDVVSVKSNVQQADHGAKRKVADDETGSRPGKDKKSHKNKKVKR